MKVSVELQGALHDFLQMADIMVILMERCDGELGLLRRYLKPGVDIEDACGLSAAIFQAYEIRKRAKELRDSVESD